MKVFVAGMSGTGKSTVANELKKRNFNIIDIDHVPGLCSWVDKETRKKVDASNIESVGDDFMEQHDYECDVEILKEMVNQAGELVFVFGNVGDNSSLLPLFDKVFLLQCYPETLLVRLKTRDTNSFGKDETVHYRVLDWCKIFDKLMLSAGAIAVDAELPLEQVVENILEKCNY